MILDSIEIQKILPHRYPFLMVDAIVEMERLKRLAAMPDEQIDTSDIPELTNFASGVRGRFYRPLTQSVTIRLNAPDIEAASTLEGQRHALPDLHQGPAAPGAGARGEVGSCAEAQA